MGEPARQRNRVDSVLDVMLMLDDEELWEFVCRMLRGTDQATIEDVYDVLIGLKHEHEPTVSFQKVFGKSLKEIRGA